MNNMGDCLNSMITMTVSSTSRMVCRITTGNWTAYIYLKNQVDVSRYSQDHHVEAET